MAASQHHINERMEESETRLDTWHDRVEQRLGSLLAEVRKVSGQVSELSAQMSKLVKLQVESRKE